MAGNELNQKYTIEKYCSKADLVKVFGTGIVEPIWNELNEFRRRLSVELPIYDASHNKFRLTYVDPTTAKQAQLNDNVSAYVGSYSKLEPGSVAQYTFTRDMLKNSLKAIARYNKIDASEVILSNILDGHSVDEQYRILSKYYFCLLALQKSTSEDINENFLAKYYSILRGEEELTCFYRINDEETLSSKALVDRTYDNGIPSSLIDDSMAELLNYISNSDVSLASRLSATFFMFNFVKPFDLFNMELACLVAKRIIAESNANAACIYVPIESFINDYSFFTDVSREVIRTRDFTYAFIKGADLAINSFSAAIDRIVDVHATSLDKEVKLGSDIRKYQNEFNIKPEEKKTPEKKVETKKQIIEKAERNAVHFDSEVLSEKELKAKAAELLEKDPFLNKHQADFYVHHCTPGRYYSIQQYVKFERVVYETARTSLDLLAKRGYYREQSVKNKYVYTPINKE